jgi:hypothetical protein
MKNAFEYTTMTNLRIYWTRANDLAHIFANIVSTVVVARRLLVALQKFVYVHDKFSSGEYILEGVRGLFMGD